MVGQQMAFGGPVDPFDAANPTARVRFANADSANYSLDQRNKWGRYSNPVLNSKLLADNGVTTKTTNNTVLQAVGQVAGNLNNTGIEFKTAPTIRTDTGQTKVGGLQYVQTNPLMVPVKAMGGGLPQLGWGDYLPGSEMYGQMPNAYGVAPQTVNMVSNGATSTKFLPGTSLQPGTTATPAGLTYNKPTLYKPSAGQQQQVPENNSLPPEMIAGMVGKGVSALAQLPFLLQKPEQIAYDQTQMPKFQTTDLTGDKRDLREQTNNYLRNARGNDPANYAAYAAQAGLGYTQGVAKLAQEENKMNNPNEFNQRNAALLQQEAARKMQIDELNANARTGKTQALVNYMGGLGDTAMGAMKDTMAYNQQMDTMGFTSQPGYVAKRVGNRMINAQSPAYGMLVYQVKGKTVMEVDNKPVTPDKFEKILQKRGKYQDAKHIGTEKTTP